MLADNWDNGSGTFIATSKSLWSVRFLAPEYRGSGDDHALYAFLAYAKIWEARKLGFEIYIAKIRPPIKGVYDWDWKNKEKIREIMTPLAVNEYYPR